MTNSKIQWTDHTFNAWEGCTKVAPECKNCYAETLVDHRFHRAKWGKGQPRRRTSENLWKQPLAWNKTATGFAECRGCGRRGFANTWDADIRKAHADAITCCPDQFLLSARPRVFCLSLGDWLDEEVPIEWLADLLARIHATPNLDWQLLTKRPGNWRERISRVLSELIRRSRSDHHVVAQHMVARWLDGIAPSNVWIGVSAGADQKAALEIPAKIHFLSCEPMLHALNTTHAAGFDQIIFGGESGKNARVCKVRWIRDGVGWCLTHGVLPFVKQLGGNLSDEDLDECARASGKSMQDSHGGDMSEWPEDLRVREFPKVREAVAA
jgi:protein gp37